MGISLTAVDLHDLEACDSQVELFKRLYPRGITCPTAAQVRGALAQGLSVGWLVRVLSPASLWAEYDRQRASLWAEYDRQRASLWAESERQHAPLWAESERQHAPLWAEYDRQRASLFAEYERQRVPLWAEYERQHESLLADALAAVWPTGTTGKSK